MKVSNLKEATVFLFVVLALTLTVTVTSSPAPASVSNARLNSYGKKVVTQGGEDPDPAVREKRDFVQQMLKDSWDDYVRYAWGENELKPVSKTGQNGGIYGDSKIGATIIDALDTLFIMGYDDEFKVGRDWIEQNLNFSAVNTTVSLFETNIRIVGGFLTSFALTGDQLFVKKAVEIADLLLPAFDSPSGIPYGDINLATGVPRPNQDNSLAGLGTLHLEFVYLSQVTGNPIYKEKVDKIRQVVRDAQRPADDMYRIHISTQTGQYVDDRVSIGASADSFYEYLLKAAIQFDDKEAREMYDGAMNSFVNNGLVRYSRPSNLLYFAEYNEGQVDDISTHLGCFAGGMLALGSHVAPANNANKGRDMEIGKNFTNTCHESYTRTATQIGPEVFRFSSTLEAEAGPSDSKYYILRPEVIESYFVLYRLTGDSKYRDWGWEAAQAIQRHCKVGPGRGYSGLTNVNSQNPQKDDVQQTFFLAETLKYLYLLFSSNELMSLDEWVFNTECHPLPIKATNPLY